MNVINVHGEKVKIMYIPLPKNKDFVYANENA